TMTTSEQFHDLAVEYTDRAIIARQAGRFTEALLLFRQAFEQERKAVDALLQSDRISEPWRSVLCRSAATLAHDCGDVSEAIRLIDLGLTGAAPRGIRSELQQLKNEIESVSGPEHGQRDKITT